MRDNVGTRGDKAAARVLADGIIMAHEATDLQCIQGDGIITAHAATQLQPFVLASGTIIIIIIIDNFCIALFSGVPKFTALYNILQHFLSFTNVVHIIMTTNNL